MPLVLEVLTAKVADYETAADPKMLVADGNRMWDAAAALTGHDALEAKLAAAEKYLAARDSLTGLGKVLVEKRLGELRDLTSIGVAVGHKTRGERKSGNTAIRIVNGTGVAGRGQGRWLNLLPMIHPQKDTVQGGQGAWTMDRGELISSGHGQELIEIPYQPPDEYDFRVTFTVKSGKCLAIQILYKANTPFIWVMNGTSFTFHYLRSGDDFHNETSGAALPGIVIGVQYTSVVQVRDKGVRVYLNGKLMRDWKTDFKNIVQRPWWALRDNSLLGLASGDSQTVFHAAEVLEVTGNGRLTRPP